MPLPRITPEQLEQLAAATVYLPALNDALQFLHEALTADPDDIESTCDFAAKECMALAEQAKRN
jgi:hypothetical protein